MGIELRHGALCAAADAAGGELVSLRKGETEYIWGGDPAHWSGRNPILFPIVGNLKNGTVRFQGKPFHMERHGFARRSMFTPADRGEDFIVFQLRESPETLEQYPFPFSLQVIHRLTDSGFSTTFRVENPGPDPMPFCIGAHTAFRCPLNPGERFGDYELAFDQPETGHALPLTPQGLLSAGAPQYFLDGAQALPLDYGVFAQLDTLIFQNLRSTAVSLRHRATGRGVRMSFEGFPLIAFWTHAGSSAPFLCLEPWHGCAAREDESGEFAHKPHSILLEPGAQRTLTYSVEIL